jgi:hypothetical protein
MSSKIASSKPSQLPSHLPVGTRYVIEGRGGRILRYIEFPDGRQVQLPADLAERAGVRGSARRRVRQKATARKF